MKQKISWFDLAFFLSLAAAFLYAMYLIGVIR